MKTAIQQFIEVLNKDVNSNMLSKDELFGYYVAIDIAKEFLIKEKLQIIDAYDWGLIDGEKDEKEFYNGHEFYLGFYIEAQKQLEKWKLENK
jgi:hypothetical protein